MRGCAILSDPGGVLAASGEAEERRGRPRPAVAAADAAGRAGRPRPRRHGRRRGVLRPRERLVAVAVADAVYARVADVFDMRNTLRRLAAETAGS